MTEALLHEMRHSAWDHLQLTARLHVHALMTEEEYIAWKIIEEADTFAIQIEHEIHRRGGLARPVQCLSFSPCCVPAGVSTRGTRLDFPL